MSDYNSVVHKEQGGLRQVVGSGGSLDIESGGEVDFEAGSSIKIAGVAMTATAAEVNKLSGATVTTAEINLNDLSAVGALLKVKKIHVAAGDWSTETDSTWDLPAKSLVLDVFIDVTTLQGGKTVDIGLLSSEAGGDADGFANDISLATAGIVRPGAVLDGTANWYVASARGALLAKYAAGTNADDRGLYSEIPHPSTLVTAKSVTYTTSTAITAVFDIYIVYVELG